MNMKKNNSICGCCAHFNEDTNKCKNKKGKLYGIKLTEQLFAAEHDCSKYEEVTYVITPKGLLLNAMQEAGVEVDGRTFESIWNEFVSGMEKHGYLKEEEPNESDEEFTEEGDYAELY